MKKKLFAIVAATSVTVMSVGAQPACSPDYSNVTLTAATQTGPYIASALKLAADEWKKKTCGNVKVVEFPWSELYPKIVTALTSNSATFDVVTFAPAWSPDLVSYSDAHRHAAGQGLGRYRTDLSQSPDGV